MGFKLKLPSISPDAFKIVGGLAAMSGALGAIVYYGYEMNVAGESPGMRPLILWIALAVFMIFAALWGVTQWARLGPALGAMTDRFARAHRAIQELNVILAIDYRYCAAIDSDRVWTSLELQAVYDKYIEEVLAHASAVFLSYTGKTCAASIKALSGSASEKLQLDPDAPQPAAGASTVFTLARDGQSRQERGDVDDDGSPLANYAYSLNTAFKSIMHSPDLGGYFFGNSLTSMPPGKYTNARPEWWKHYDNVAVACLKNPCRTSVERAIGFVCIDSKDGKFDDQVCRQILECIASVLYYSIRKTTGLFAKMEVRAP